MQQDNRTFEEKLLRLIAHETVRSLGDRQAERTVRNTVAKALARAIAVQSAGIEFTARVQMKEAEDHGVKELVRLAPLVANLHGYMANPANHTQHTPQAEAGGYILNQKQALYLAIVGSPEAL